MTKVKDHIATITEYTLSDTVSTTISVAKDERTMFIIDGRPEKGVWIKLQAASVDNDKKGIYMNELEKGDSRWEMTDKNYTGEISAIANSSGVVKISVTEY